ncbi:MAG: diguanylate cyclase [Desulfobacterales bacterium]|nr:diguanylate cyclase [Desulfobacterales bacterium]
MDNKAVIQNILKELVTFVFEGIKTYSEGDAPSKEYLINFVIEKTNFVNFLETQINGSIPPNQEQMKHAKQGQIGEIFYTDVTKLQSQKYELIKQCDEIKDQYTKVEIFYKQVISTLSKLVAIDENSPLFNPFTNFILSVNNSENISGVEEEFIKLKNDAIKSGILSDSKHNVTTPKKISFFSKWLKNKEESPKNDSSAKSVEVNLGIVKNAFKEIVNELKLNFDEKFIDKLLKIEKNLTQLTKMNQLLAFKEDLIEILKEYISANKGEHEKNAEFIKDITSKINEFEKYFLDDSSHEDKSLTKNDEFNSILNDHVDTLNKATKQMKTLDELRSVVVAKLSFLREAIEQKKAFDRIWKFHSSTTKSNINSMLGQMKKEIISAHEHAKNLEIEILKDSLTGIFNRRAYDKKISEQMSSYLLGSNTFSLLIIDIDHFKKINDTYGHTVGDSCLKGIIRKIQPALRSNDFIARYGGEEFAVILPGAAYTEALEIAERLRITVEKTDIIFKDEKIQVTISIGVTQAREEDTSPETIFIRADKALYQAKNEGRNRVILV